MKLNLSLAATSCLLLTSCGADSRITDHARDLASRAKAAPASPELNARFKSLFEEVRVRKALFSPDCFITSRYEEFRANLASALSNGESFLIISEPSFISGEGHIEWTTYFRELAGKGASLNDFEIRIGTHKDHPDSFQWKDHYPIQIDIPPYGVASHKHEFPLSSLDPAFISAEEIFKGHDWGGKPVYFSVDFEFGKERFR
jgi:hypothetical protein